MKLYLIGRDLDAYGKPTYDEALGFVVAANTPSQALKVCDGLWGDYAPTGDESVQMIGYARTTIRKAALILRDFHAG